MCLYFAGATAAAAAMAPTAVTFEHEPPTSQVTTCNLLVSLGIRTGAEKLDQQTKMVGAKKKFSCSQDENDPIVRN